MLSEEKSMAIERGNLLVAPPGASGSGYISAAYTRTERYLARLSGRRRHVRRTSGTPANDAACCNSSSGSNSSSSQKSSEDETQPTPSLQPRTGTVPNNPKYEYNSDYTTDAAAAAAYTETAATTAPSSSSFSSSSSSFSSSSTSSSSSSSSPLSSFRARRIPPYIATILIITYYTLFGIADACSSRSTPKPRPPTPTPRPNITFHMYACPPDYAEWYCLNGATCFTVKIAESLLYNCLCANGYIGQRCEFKDLDGSYLPSRQRVMLETASIAGGATIAVFLVVIICIAAYIHCKRKQKELRSSSNCVDTVDGPGRDPELRPFSNHGRSLRIFMANKNSNNTTTSPSIEQTRMPGWNYSSPETTRMASISEGKRSNNQ